MTDNSVLVEREGAAAIITLNAPDRLNAIDATMASALDDAFADAGTDPAVRAIMITGMGRGFCAGASMDRLDEIRQGGSGRLTSGSPAEGDAVFDRFDAPPQFRTRYTIPLAIPKPVIAAVNGPCAGAGLMLALACDIRIASDTAKFVASFAKLGLIAEGASAYLLPRIVGYSLANDMLLTGRPVPAGEALQAGLVTSLTPADEFADHARQLVCSVAGSVSPTATRFIKRQLQHGLSADLSDSIDLAYRGMLDALARPDFSEGIKAFAEKRPPVFSPAE